MVYCMVIWSMVNNGDFIKVDEFFYLYRLMELKLKGYWKFRPWEKKQICFLISPSSHRDSKQCFFLVSGEGWEFLPNENLEEAPKFLCQWRTPMSGASFSCFLPFFLLCGSCNKLAICFLPIKTRPPLKSRYKDRLKRVLKNMGEVKDFDNLISPESLSLHFLGPKPTGGVSKHVKSNKRS